MKKEVGSSRMRPAMIRGIAVIAAIVTASTTLLTGSAYASDFPPANTPGGGMTVSGEGQWVNYQRMEEITLTVCDAAPWDQNKATAQLQAYVIYNGTARIATANAIFQVPQGLAKCKQWRDVFLTYNRPGEHLDYARYKLYGSQDPSSASFGKWLKNPFQIP